MPRVRSGGGSAKDRRTRRRAVQFASKDVQAARLRIQMNVQKQKIRAADKIIDWNLTSTERMGMSGAMLSTEKHKRQNNKPTDAQIATARKARAAVQKKLTGLEQQMAALNQ